MNDNSMADVNSGIPRNAVSVYTQDSGMDDFPVLKAFQQYIDAEQAKARKRLVTMGIFFALLTGAVIAIFVAMLATLSQRNQLLNDRLVEFAMSERNRPQSAPVVVQSTTPQQPSDAAALQALSAKLDEMQEKFAEREKKAEEAQKAAAEKPAGPTPEQQEIARLKALLDVERQKAAAEAERRRQEELEAYRRKHYPELYRQPAPQRPEQTLKKTTRESSNTHDEIDEVLNLLDENDAIDYFKEEEPTQSKVRPPSQPKIPAEKQEPQEKPGSSWRIPAE